MNIDLVIATYNGEQYLDEQISSINEQKLDDNYKVKYICVDDGSSDDSLSILHHKIPLNNCNNIYNKDNSNSGPCKNFSRGLEKTTSDYIMLSDQDDIWLPDKIKKSFDKLKEIEDKIGKDKPILVFTDLCVVDRDLNTICDSFFTYQSMNPSWSNDFMQLLVQNVAPGCTMIFNRALLDKARPIPEDAIMHDWWLILVASAFGQVSYLDEPTILYRQHGNNQVGAKKISVLSYWKGFRKSTINLINTSKQASVFVQHYENEINLIFTKDELASINNFSNITNRGLFKNLASFFNGEFRKNNLIRNLGMLFSICFISLYNFRENKND